MAKARISIPPEVAARILFLHDRTCCVCRERGKPVQIHHIDVDPSNNEIKNLAVLCFECHRETQIRGGFDRKLDGDQVTLYRNDWFRVVAHTRVQEEAHRELIRSNTSPQLELATSVAEIYRENRQYELLAFHYHSMGNVELRDKYIEMTLAEGSNDQAICTLRGLQDRPDLIPIEVVRREEARYDANKDWSQKGRFLLELRKYREATVEYLKGILESLEEGNTFSAAYYLEEFIQEHLTERLFEEAYRAAAEKKDLWWQVQALKHLGWTDELQELLRKNHKLIESSGELLLQIELAEAEGEIQRAIELRKKLAQGTRVVIYQGGIHGEDEEIVSTLSDDVRSKTTRAKKKAKRR